MSWRSSRWRTSGLVPDQQVETLVESVPATLTISPETRAALRDAGRRLARNTDRYGNPLPIGTASVIAVERASDTETRVRVSDHVGFIAVPGLQLHVIPKIPTPHLLGLARQSRLIPRVTTGAGSVAAADDLAVLVATWFINALERVIEQGLASDYREQRDELPVVRGRIVPLDTVRLLHRGRLAVVAEYEEFDADTPLNRLLLEAARRVAAGAPLPHSLRSRAARSVVRMDGVGRFRADDANAGVERRTSHYRDAAELAREVLRSTGRTLDAGSSRGWTFLVRTPELVEAGIREVLADGLPSLAVQKRKVSLGASGLTVSPDIVFGSDGPVADVKYKVDGAGWEPRADLYEVVAFAAALRTPTAAIIRFRSDSAPSPPPLSVGDFVVNDLMYRARSDWTPQQAVEDLVDQTRAWLGMPAAAAA